MLRALKTSPLTLRASLVPLASLVLLVALTLAGCAKASPTLTPTGQVYVTSTQVVKALDVLRDTAIAASAQSPPVISLAETRQIVNFHEAAVKTIAAVPLGWKSTVQAALSQLQSTLSAGTWQKLLPYVTLVQTLLVSLP